jgi:phage terminase large subunit-like protein|nr:MAG TPA: Large Terminase [Caudoviricetes sp.]
MFFYYDGREFCDGEFSLYLISKYLADLFTKDAIKNIISKFKPEEIACMLGEKDISFFSLYYLRDYYVPSSENDVRNLAPVHFEIWDELNHMFVDDEWDKEEFILPRGCAKSTIINKTLGCWRHCYRKTRYTIVLGNKASDAEQFIKGTKQMLQNKRIVEAFGVLVDKKHRIVNNQELELTNDTKLQAFSWGSSVRGTTYEPESGGIYRPEVVLCDDIISKDDVLTEQAKEKVINKFNTEVREVGDKAVFRNGKKIKMATKFLVIGTPLAADCFINYIKNNDPEYRIFHRRVCDFDVDEFFKSHHWLEFKKILFDFRNEKRKEDAIEFFITNQEEMEFETIWEKYDCADLAIAYFSKRLAFMQELQCDCDHVGDIWITAMAKLSQIEIEEKSFEKTILAVDQAAAAKTESDYFAFTVGSKSNGLYFVRKGMLKKINVRTNFDLYVDTVIFLLMKYEAITHVILEKNVFKGIDAGRIEEKIKSIEILKKRHIQVIDLYNTKNKDDRISTITEKINSGQVIFNEADEEYNDQIKDFRGQNFTLHDDAIDSLEMFINNIDTIKVFNPKVEILDKKKFFKGVSI